jgi:Na+/proline symporter
VIARDRDMGLAAFRGPVCILVTYNVRVTERAAITGMLANLLTGFVL